MGGIIVDGGTFDFGSSGRHPGFTEPDESYHGQKCWGALGPGAFILKARVQLLRDAGAAIRTFSAFLIINGLQPQIPRMDRPFANDPTICEYPAVTRNVESVANARTPPRLWPDQKRV